MATVDDKSQKEHPQVMYLETEGPLDEENQPLEILKQDSKTSS